LGHQSTSLNFAFLRVHDVRLVQLGALAERYFTDDPSTALFKLRQYAEVMVKIVAARTATDLLPNDTFADILRRLKAERVLPQPAAELFYKLKDTGNTAVHDLAGTHRDALVSLRLARELGIWFHRTFANEPNFSAGPFIPPKPPEDPSAVLKAEITELRRKADEAQTAAARAAAEAAAHFEAAMSEKERARREAEDRATWEQLATDTEARVLRLSAELETLRAAAQAQPQAVEAIIEHAETAAREINLDEVATRSLIDLQLRQAGWEADTQTLRFSEGTRPAKGRSLAIAEWPTESGPADYALFVGFTLVGVVEAKRRNRSVMEVLPQAERYSKGARLHGSHVADGGPWGAYKVPFIFSANGRPYLKQIEALSGIWRRDIRRPANPAEVISAWPTPQGLLDRLAIDKDAAQAALKETGFEFGFPLRAYQKRAIETVEACLAEERRQMLVAMATGTGKTKLAIAMLYRLLNAKRFRRICFVVDRSALGDQTQREFETTKVVNGKEFADIFGIEGLANIKPDPATRMHICTIQGLVKRVLYADDPADAPPIDQYDLMIVDECHRGYLLDREMSDTELSFRSQNDYVSKYRRVLEYFDAVKIGLTATPALHTTDIFGKPVFTYSYREAVVDGFLIDHEPPLRIETELSTGGIHFTKGETVEVVHTKSGTLKTAELPDDLDFEVEQFNKSVLTPKFNKAIAEELVGHIDLADPDKTLIFAVNVTHADLIVKELRDAYRAKYGDIEDNDIRRITGNTDNVAKVILSFRNDAQPKIAVTVDLLTTGIDVPKITNLVFMRRVNSRILYEQMLGRATRLCPEIDKKTFRIFDAVGIYDGLQDVTEMKPVVVKPNISLEALFKELADVEDAAHKAAVRDQIVVKLRRKLKKLPNEVRAQFELEAGETPEDTLERLRRDDPSKLAKWVKARPKLGPILDWTNDDGTPRFVPISTHDDKVISVTHGYGDGQRPEDFLDKFNTFVRENQNKIAALKVVVQRPQDLTREQLRELKLQLDAQGFSDVNVAKAWKQAKNEDIAASIVGFIRKVAIGSPLVPFGQRVRAAVERVKAKGSFTDPQVKWLNRIAEQIEKEIVVDRLALDDEPFKANGGFRIIDKRFDGKLINVLATINEELWKDAG
jgi:type I restriction enzyme R subunit